jgi:Predicted methyltransferase regulatory domain
MTDWTAGYDRADIGYTYGYYLELNPLRVKQAFLNAGLVAPEFGTACELGFGQGLSTNMHAAASVCSWHGTDFTPAQAGFAKELASVSGANANLFDESFAEFAKRDLPEFDYIGLHGIWSWVSEENDQVIADFIRKKLKVGGVLYISYNTFPGWGTFAPMRHLMTEHADVMGAAGAGIISRVDGAVDFTEKLLATNPKFARENPAVAERIAQIKGQSRLYVAHEYFNRHWHPMHFATMAKWMDSAKLTYACSAHYLDHLDAINLTPEQQSFLKEISDPIFKQTVRDFMVNQQFRKDYWVKGARRLTPMEQSQGLRAQRLLMTVHRPDVNLKVTGSLGEATLTEKVYAPLLDLMADHKVRTLAQIEQVVKDENITFVQLVQAVLVLCGTGSLSAAQEDAVTAKAKAHTDKLNTHLMIKARSSNDINFLASPVTGGGVAVGRFHQLFVLAMQSGNKKPEEWAGFVAQILTDQGQWIIKDGKPLDSAEAQLAEIILQAKEFAAKQLPILKALLIA